MVDTPTPAGPVGKEYAADASRVSPPPAPWAPSASAEEAIRGSLDRALKDREDLRAAREGTIKELRSLDVDRQNSLNQEKRALEQLQPPKIPILPPAPTAEGLTRANAGQRILPIMFAAAALVAGALFSKRSLAPLAAASAAAAGALTGWKQRDHETYEAKFKEWNANTKLALESWKMQREQYSESLAFAKTMGGLTDKSFQAERDAALREMNILAAINNDDKMITALQIQGIEGAYKLNDYRMKSEDHTRKVWEQGIKFKAAMDEINEYQDSPDFEKDSKAERARHMAEILNHSHEKPSETFNRTLHEIREHAYQAALGENNDKPADQHWSPAEAAEKHAEYLSGKKPDKAKSSEDEKLAEQLFKEYLRDTPAAEPGEALKKREEIKRAVAASHSGATPSGKGAPAEATKPPTPSGSTLWDKLFGASPQAPPTPPSTEEKETAPDPFKAAKDKAEEEDSNIPVITSQEEYDQLADGDPFYYVGDDGEKTHHVKGE